MQDGTQEQTDDTGWREYARASAAEIIETFDRDQWDFQAKIFATTVADLANAPPEQDRIIEVIRAHL